MPERFDPNRREFIKQLGGLAGVAVTSRFLIGSNLVHANVQKEATEFPPIHPEFHKRLEHPKEGAIHVWHPEHSGQLEDVVIFIHGTDSDADKSWEELNLKGQFKGSEKKSLFVVPSFAKDGYDRLRWKGDLGALIGYVISEIGIRPKNGVTVIAHSHGYRTLITWLDYEHLDSIILSDSLYEHSHVNPYVEWVNEEGNTLILIAPKKERYPTSTEHNIKRIIERAKKWNNKDTHIIDGVPERLDDELIQNLPDIIHFISQYPHGQIPRSEKVYSVVLGLTGR